jgi:hypothetical protein
MGTLISSLNLSLDGFVDMPDGGLGWALSTTKVAGCATTAGANAAGCDRPCGPVPGQDHWLLTTRPGSDGR